MNHKTEDASSSAPCLQLSEQQYVRSISENPLIEDIFRFNLWGTGQGIDYLVGIYETTYDEEQLVNQLVSLDGLVYKRGKDDDVIERFFSLHDRLSDIWRHSRRKDQYTPGYFIRWGLRLKDVFQISWLEDARSKGLVSEEWISKPLQAASPNEYEEMPNGKEKQSLLMLIGGLYVARYGMQSKNTTKAVSEDLQFAGPQLDPRTIKRHLRAALRYVSRPIADKELASK